MNTTYITFGSTNPYQASSGRYCGLFRGRTKVAVRANYCTKNEASRRLMQDCYEECDNHYYDDTRTKVEVEVLWYEFETIMEQGDMSYHHDGYGWETIALADLTEEEARVTLRDNVLFDERDKQTIYAMYPDLAPVPVEDEAGAAAS